MGSRNRDYQPHLHSPLRVRDKKSAAVFDDLFLQKCFVSKMLDRTFTSFLFHCSNNSIKTDTSEQLIEIIVILRHYTCNTVAIF